MDSKSLIGSMGSMGSLSPFMGVDPLSSEEHYQQMIMAN